MKVSKMSLVVGQAYKKFLDIIYHVSLEVPKLFLQLTGLGDKEAGDEEEGLGT